MTDSEQRFWDFVEETAPEEGHDPVELRRHVEKRSQERTDEINRSLMDLNRRYFRESIQPSLRPLIMEASKTRDAERLSSLAREQTLLARFLSRSFS